MSIEYRYGDLLETDCRYICHCVNAQGKMASGVAKAIRSKFPKAYDVYTLAYAEGRLRLGAVIGADCGEKVILNLVGQKYYGNDRRLYLNYTALRRGLSLINKNIKEPVAFPAIGCGLAGGDWKLVSSIIEEETTNFTPVVYLLNDSVPF